MTSTIVLYSNVGFTPVKNFIVESFEDYLSNKYYEKIEKFQYIKHGLYIQIKIALSQFNQEFKPNYDYVCITNDDSGAIPVYYFIRKMTPRAKDTILFELEMDVLNTFKYNVQYTASIRTRITREHKNRWRNNLQKNPIIDRVSEEISVPLFKYDSKDIISKLNLDWYLVYKTNTTATEDNPQPINCYLAPSSQIRVIAEDRIIVDASVLSGIGTGLFIFLNRVQLGTNNYKEVTFTYNNQTKTIRTSQYIAGLGELQTYGFTIKEDPNHPAKISISTYVWKNGDIASIPYWSATLLETFDNITQAELTGNPADVGAMNTQTFINNMRNVIDNHTFTAGTTPVTIDSIDSIDRTDVTLLKIIALPYSPIDYRFDSNNDLIVDTNWDFDSGTNLLKLKDLGTKFHSQVESEVTNPIWEFYNRQASFYDIDPNRERDDDLETKIYHSDFYGIKFVYDSFGYNFNLQDTNGLEARDEFASKFTFDFYVTNTMNSRFMFNFDESFWNEYSQEDYDNILIVNRNNESIIYNSPYLNYLRVGYNYDVKNKARTEFTAGLNIAGQVASTGLAIASGNPAVAVSGAFRGVTGIVSTIVSLASNEDAFNQNLEKMKIQKVSVAGADDLDLLFAYSKNRAKLITYRCSDIIKYYLLDLFYYYGYKTNRIGVPYINTRYWFNFVQCDLELQDILSNYIPDECKEMIVLKFSQGVTFMHKQNNEWDIEQTKNNIEIFLNN